MAPLTAACNPRYIIRAEGEGWPPLRSLCLWPYRSAVRTTPSHGVDRGSIPLRATTFGFKHFLTTSQCDHRLRPLLMETREMSRQVTLVLYVLPMVAVIVGVDFAFFRNRFWERLAVNIGIVLISGAFCSRFLARP